MTNKLINGKIYKLTTNNTDDIYIGSTTKCIEERLRQHIKDYNTYINGFKSYYLSSYNVVRHDDVKTELLYDGMFNSRAEMLEMEGEFIRTTPHCINKEIAGRSHKQYLEEHKEQIETKRKEYYQKNRESILEKKKEYGIKNREHKIEYLRDYYQKNKEQLNDKAKQIFVCDCGTSCRISDKARHMKSQKHQQFINNSL